MTVVTRRRRRTALRTAVDVMLVAIAGVLIVASVDHLTRKVSAIDRRQLDLRTFRRWAAPQPGAAFSTVRIAATAPAADVVCGTRAHRHGRTCIAVRRGPGGARVVAAAFIPAGQPAVHNGRLVCQRRLRRCTLGGGPPPRGAVRP
jgi:hypothetical protein